MSVAADPRQSLLAAYAKIDAAAKAKLKPLLHQEHPGWGQYQQACEEAEALRRQCVAAGFSRAEIKAAEIKDVE